MQYMPFLKDENKNFIYIGMQGCLVGTAFLLWVANRKSSSTLCCCITPELERKCFSFLVFEFFPFLFILTRLLFFNYKPSFPQTKSAKQYLILGYACQLCRYRYAKVKVAIKSTNTDLKYQISYSELSGEYWYIKVSDTPDL